MDSRIIEVAHKELEAEKVIETILDKEHFTRKYHKQVITALQWVKLKKVGGDIIEFKGETRELQCRLNEGKLEISKKSLKEFNDGLQGN